jgi:hypothetical protein
MAGVRTFEVNVFVKKYAGLMLRSSSAMFTVQWAVCEECVIDMMTEKEELGDFQVFFLRVCVNVCVYVCQTPTYSCVYDGEGVFSFYSYNQVFVKCCASDPNKDLQVYEGIDGVGPYTKTLLGASPKHFSRSS